MTRYMRIESYLNRAGQCKQPAIGRATLGYSADPAVRQN